ncbi:hypothetical protein [Nocardia sp. IFM 10818]
MSTIDVLAQCDPRGGACPTADPIPDTSPQAPPLFDGHGWKVGELQLPDWTATSTTALVTAAVTLLLGVTALTTLATRWTWTPARMRNFALGCVVAMPGSAILLGGFDPAVPWTQFRAGMAQFETGSPGHGLLMMSVLLGPLAWALALFYYTDKVVTAHTTGFRSEVNTERFLDGFRERQQQVATRLARYPLPLTTSWWNPSPVLGRFAAEMSVAPPTTRRAALLQRYRWKWAVPWGSTRTHLITVANTGAGKTALVERFLVAWWATAWLRHRQWWRLRRPGRPLGVLIDCNGGPDSERLADTLVEHFVSMGLLRSRIAVFPRIRLGLWNLDSAADMRAVLSAMITGAMTPATTTERYFYEMAETLIHLIVDAPEYVDEFGRPRGWNPPRSFEEFLDRVDEQVLAYLWGGTGWDPEAPWTGARGVERDLMAVLAGDEPVLPTMHAQAGNLFRHLGDAFDGDATFEDFDVMICILEGTTQAERARAQYGALGCMLEQLADRRHKRETLVATDEFSVIAATGLVRADAWVQRFRKALIGTWFITQFWNGLGNTDDRRESLVGSGAGGAILGRQEVRDGRLTGFYGTRRRWSAPGVFKSRAERAAAVKGTDVELIDANVLRRLEVGDFIFVRNGTAEVGHVRRLDDERLPLLRGADRMIARPVPQEELAEVIDLGRHRRA